MLGGVTVGRIVFTEVTKRAVQAALAQPRPVLPSPLLCLTDRLSRAFASISISPSWDESAGQMIVFPLRLGQ